MIHQNPTKQDRKATARYNFVRLPEKILRPPQDTQDELNQDTYRGLSGSFEITIETSSPLFIRGMLTPDRYKRLGKKKDLTDMEKEELATFFSLNNRPRIPGSSLRGMFRTLVEILSYSKLYEITDEHYMYRSVDTSRHGDTYRKRLFDEPVKNELHPRFLAGYMQRDGTNWYIRPAIEVNGVTFGRVSHHKLRDSGVPAPEVVIKQLRDREIQIKLVQQQPVFVKPGEVKLQDMLGGFVQINFMRIEAISSESKPDEQITQPATLAISSNMDSKKSEAVVFPMDESKTQPNQWIKISHKLERNYRENSIPEFMGIKLDGENGVFRDKHPVFYLLDDQGKLISLGHCPMIRVPYVNSPQELLPEGIRATEWPDLAERIFGYVKKKDDQETEARAGRLFFEDATLIESCEPVFEHDADPVAPKVLSAPKPTSFQHYLAQPNPDDTKELLDYDDQTIPRGNKLYWARGEAPDYLEDLKRVERYPKQYTRIKPLSKGNQFKFKLRFDNLTDIELGVLAYILQIGQDPKYRLRIGMGKPYGLGAIRFSKIETKLINREDRYKKLFAGDGAWFDGAIPTDDAEVKLEAARKAFEAWGLSDAEVNPDGKKTLAELKRIAELLRMLSWPGPDAVYTLDITVLKEFSERKVLPDPFAIPLPKVTKPTVVAEILEKERNTFICGIEGQDDSLGKIDSKYDQSFHFKEGEKYQCEILSEIVEYGETVYILRPLKKV